MLQRPHCNSTIGAQASFHHFFQKEWMRYCKSRLLNIVWCLGTHCWRNVDTKNIIRLDNLGETSDTAAIINDETFAELEFGSQPLGLKFPPLICCQALLGHQYDLFGIIQRGLDKDAWFVFSLFHFCASSGFSLSTYLCAKSGYFGSKGVYLFKRCLERFLMVSQDLLVFHRELMTSGTHK